MADEQKLPLWQKLGYASFDAWVEKWTEQLPLDTLIKGIAASAPLRSVFWNTLKKELVGEEIATALQDLNDWATFNKGRTFMDYIEELPRAAIQTAIATAIGTGGNVAIGAASSKAFDQFTDMDWRALQAVDFQKRLDEAMKLPAESALRARSPEVFRKHMEEVTGNKTIFVDGAVLNQLPPDVLAILPEQVRAQIPDAVQAVKH